MRPRGGNETAQVHDSFRRRVSMATRGACAAAREEAIDRIYRTRLREHV